VNWVSPKMFNKGSTVSYKGVIFIIKKIEKIVAGKGYLFSKQLRLKTYFYREVNL
jgi:translation elongation factor P/translation initiation factor 5A